MALLWLVPPLMAPTLHMACKYDKPTAPGSRILLTKCERKICWAAFKQWCRKVLRNQMVQASFSFARTMAKHRLLSDLNGGGRLAVFSRSSGTSRVPRVQGSRWVLRSTSYRVWVESGEHVQDFVMVLSRQKLGSGFQTWRHTRSSALSDLLKQKLRSWNGVQQSVFYERFWHSLKFVNHWAREKSCGGWSRKVGYTVENKSY